jgi:hypothetical protein
VQRRSSRRCTKIIAGAALELAAAGFVQFPDSWPPGRAETDLMSSRFPLSAVFALQLLATGALLLGLYFH